MSSLLAHSGRKARGLGPQTYCDHIQAVRANANQFAEEALLYFQPPKIALQAAVDWAGLFHDLGKLESENQSVLATQERGRLPVNHVDAGVAYALGMRQVEAALLVYSHHKGLCDLPIEKGKQDRARQDPAFGMLRDPNIKIGTDAALPELVKSHQIAIGGDPARPLPSRFDGLARRLLLSCLVDADHSDTAKHYGEEPDRQPAECRWAERLEALDRDVAALAKGGERDTVRAHVYQACRSASWDEPMWACDSPVGSGKTTAVMAYLLRAPIALNLRHIFVVLPFTNIVEQSVKTYRRALVLPGEDAEKVVAAHHHQTEFETQELRYLTTLWDSPITVTTAVQFFETLGANQTSRLRKLHQLPGSAVLSTKPMRRCQSISGLSCGTRSGFSRINGVAGSCWAPDLL